MKKQLNIICVLIFLVVGLSLAPSAYLMCNGFVEGFKYGMSQTEDAGENGKVEILTPVGLSLWPKSLASTSNKVMNLKSQELQSATYLKMMVWVKSKEAGIMKFGGLLSLISLFFVLKAVVNFYKLINAINHEIIFDWTNVRRLNRIGRFLLISFLLMQTYMLITYLTASRLIELEGYRFNYWCDFESMTLILGLIALLVARIFAIGLQMKEEQELTI